MSAEAGRVATLRGLVRNHGLDWVIARSLYEVERRSGLHRVRFRRREWDDDELGHWIRPGIPTDPIEYSDYRNRHSPAFLFAPADRAFDAAFERK